MTQPRHLSSPTLFTSADLHSRPDLTRAITTHANLAFPRGKFADPDRWYLPPSPRVSQRFPKLEYYYDMLGAEGVVTIIFDQEFAIVTDDEETSATGGLKEGKVVACAAVVPWPTKWATDNAGPSQGKEEGWEIKAVCVDGDEKYLRTGLVGQLLAFLERFTIDKARKEMVDGKVIGKEYEGEDGRRKGSLTQWIVAAECLNGAYWQKRGFKEVRRVTQGEGVWGCKTTFELLVMTREVEFDIET